MSFLKELWDWISTRRKYWLLPVLVALLVLGTLIILAQGSAVSPFIYAIF